ncbi:lactate utilization protein C [Bifidobacterium sp. ESL0745]|uniref:LutC/YkgG family protein n=1 Tax=Bifidobacterium sp. ESL0745 TaxID=2983226 RepID=UPI0023F7A5FB|nr:lactate utilization protein C [Bifidobacterium sp. ESL0745]MDF7665822.1 lactate utilization protein C [Bifidobacterium sp. ESL0745]
MTDREVFLDYLAQKSGRPRHQLKDHPLEPVNDLPETTLSGHDQDELLKIARKNAPAVHVDFQTTTKADLPTALNAFIAAKAIPPADSSVAEQSTIDDPAAASDNPATSAGPTAPDAASSVASAATAAFNAASAPTTSPASSPSAKPSLLLPTDDENYKAFGLEQWRDGLDPKPAFWVPGAGREANVEAANHSEAAIGFADFLCAESCTITAPTTPGQGRAFHFLPVHYLSIIRKSKIVARTRQAMDYYEPAVKSGKLKTSNINFITGTSSTGDIEMVLVVGVHGPLDMTYLVVEDM